MKKHSYHATSSHNSVSQSFNPALVLRGPGTQALRDESVSMGARGDDSAIDHGDTSEEREMSEEEREQEEYEEGEEGEEEEADDEELDLN